MGTGVATALEIVQWPTPFLTRHSASSVGRGYSKEQFPPQPQVNRRVHTGRSDPTILQYSEFRRNSNLTASQAKTWCQRNKVELRQPSGSQIHVSGNLEWDNKLLWRTEHKKNATRIPGYITKSQDSSTPQVLSHMLVSLARLAPLFK